MSLATTAVSLAIASRRTSPKLSPRRAGASSTFDRRSKERLSSSLAAPRNVTFSSCALSASRRARSGPSPKTTSCHVEPSRALWARTALIATSTPLRASSRPTTHNTMSAPRVRSLARNRSVSKPLNSTRGASVVTPRTVFAARSLTATLTSSPRLSRCSNGSLSRRAGPEPPR